MPDFSKDKTYALFDSPGNKKTIANLNSQNIKTILFPVILTKPNETSQTDSLFLKLSDFDWLIFTDVYTVEYFINSLEKLEIDLFEIDEFGVLAFGEAVSDRLRFSQLHADVIPATIKLSEVLQSLKDYIFDEMEFENLRFLILKEEKAKVALADELKKLGSKVTELTIYSTQIEENFTRLKTLLKGGAADEFIFSSPLDIINLSQIFQTESLEEVLAQTKLTTTNKQTLQTLEEFRLA
jgi:uroporphyrinogen-III synthase